MADFLEVHDESVHRIVPDGATIERVAGGLGFTEGPVWVTDHLLFSDIPRGRICRLDLLPEGPALNTYRWPSGNSNGLTLDRQRRLIACEHGTRRVSRSEPDGSIVTLADRYEGRRLNSPNDVVVRSDGTIFFTDPPYGLPNLTEGKELPFNGVYSISVDGSLQLQADDFDRPNGLAFSPDERILYIDDSPRRHIRAFDVASNGALSNSRIFAELTSSDQGSPDGMKVAEDGTIVSAGPGGIWIYQPDGKLLGRLIPPEQPANLAWGEADRQTLFITARTSVYRIRLNVVGIPVG